MLPSDTVATSVVVCPHGTRVTGGGTDIDGGTPDFEVHEGYPVDQGDADTIPDDGWQSTAYNDGSGVTRHMKTFAICKSV